MSLSPELLHRLRHNPDAELAGTEHQSTIIALLDEIDLLTAERDEWRERALRRTVEEIQAMTENEPEETPGDELRKLTGLRGKFCLYGNIDFMECGYVCANIERVRAIVEGEI